MPQAPLPGTLFWNAAGAVGPVNGLWNGLMRRIASLWLPQFPVERLNRALKHEGLSPLNVPGQAFALVESGAKGLRLAACDELALSLGLRPGQRLADARAQVPDLASALHEPEKDAATLLGLARWCERWSPWVALHEPDGLILDVTGVAHLFGGEASLLADIATRFRHIGFHLRSAIARTIGAAWAFARFDSSNLIAVPEDQERDRLGKLPVEALRLERETIIALKRLGLKTIGNLYSIPRSELARRFHGSTQASHVLLRLDQCLGESEEPLSPLKDPPLFSVRHAVMEPLMSNEGLIALLDQLAGLLCHRLEREAMGATRIILKLYRADASRAVVSAGLSSPSNDPVHFARLLRPKLEKVDLGFGIDAMSLEAEKTASMEPHESGFMEAETHFTHDLAELADHLMNHHEEARIASLAPAERHLPEWAEKLVSPSGNSSTATPPLSNIRPLTLLDRPEKIAVMAEVPDGPPLRFTWRRLSHRILRMEGPERIAPEWWQESENVKRPRDYYVVEDEQGRRFWLFREGIYGEPQSPAPAWFIHGLLA
jgi:protein ImuB